MSKKIILTWKDIERDIRKLAKELRKHNNFTKIVAVARGGLIPAYLLARALGIKYIEVICMSHYNDTEMKSKVSVMPMSRKVDIRKNWLIIDDLVDTGETALLAQKYYPESKLAVLYKKPTSKVTPDFYLKEVEGWVVFPWENMIFDDYKLKHLTNE